jgi:hypothetical protein
VGLKTFAYTIIVSAISGDRTHVGEHDPSGERISPETGRHLDASTECSHPRQQRALPT